MRLLGFSIVSLLVFVSDASHELKTPLASIRLLSDSIVQNEGMDLATVREFAADIGHEAQRLQRTTEDLLDLSRMDDGVGFVPEPADVGRAAGDALVLLRPLAASAACSSPPRWTRAASSWAAPTSCSRSSST